MTELQTRTKYYYDSENRLIQVNGTQGTCSSATACYTYDAEGRRVEKITSSLTLDYVYDNQNRVIAEFVPSAWETGYAYLNGQLLAEYTAGTTYFVTKDHLGSARLVTGPNASVVDSMDYYPFGIQMAGGSSTTHKFTGDERDSETGLDHTQFRQYSSSLTRWMTPDPAGLVVVDPTNPQSWNRYAYVGNNPLAFIDPSGMNKCYQPGMQQAYECSGDGYFDSGVPGWVWIPGDQIVAGSITSNPNETTVDVGVSNDPGFYIYLGGGAGNEGSEPPLPPCKAPGTSSSSLLNTIGIDLGATGTLAAGNGVSAQGSLQFVSSNQTPLAITGTGGGVAKGGGKVAAVPTQNGATLFGAYVGGGAQLTVSNGEPNQLQGNFQTLSVNVGLGPVNFGFTMSCSGPVCQFTISPPGISWGVGASVTAYTTNTAFVKPIIGRGCQN